MRTNGDGGLDVELRALRSDIDREQRLVSDYRAVVAVLEEYEALLADIEAVLEAEIRRRRES